MFRPLVVSMLSLVSCVSLTGCLLDGTAELDDAEEPVGESAEALCTYFAADSTISIDGLQSIASISPPASDPAYYPDDWVVEVRDFDKALRYAVAEWTDTRLDSERACTGAHMEVDVYAQNQLIGCWYPIASASVQGDWCATASGYICRLRWTLPLDPNTTRIRVAGWAFQSLATVAEPRKIKLGGMQHD